MLKGVTYNPCFPQTGTIDTDNWERVEKIFKRHIVQKKKITFPEMFSTWNLIPLGLSPFQSLQSAASDLDPGSEETVGERPLLICMQQEKSE